jgi:hypothetical protein
VPGWRNRAAKEERDLTEGLDTSDYKHAESVLTQASMIAMTTQGKIRIKVGIASAIAFVLFAFVRNSFIPDACTSTGYGYPFPVFILWCECFIEDSPWPVNPLYVAFDILFWACCWNVVATVLNQARTRQTC